MKTKFFNLILIVTSLAVISSCAEEIYPNAPILGKGLHATLASPVAGDQAQSKALSGQFKFTFEDGDQINIFLKSISNESMLYGLVPDPDDKTIAKVASQSFTLNNDTYVAIYPSQAITSGASTINLSFAGQVQSANGSTSHLSDYDFSWAEATVSNNSAHFSFAHKVAWIKVFVPVTEAATFKTLTISADEGVANSASISIASGSVTPSRTVGETLTLSLGGENGINVAAGGTLTAYVTIPASTYTHITAIAEDASGNAYFRSNSTEATIEAGKYYSMTLLKAEPVSFTDLATFGAFGDLTTSLPKTLIAFDETKYQMSCGSGTDFISFKIAELENNKYAIFKVASASIEEGSTYTVSADINGTKNEGTFTAVQKTNKSVWLLDSTGNVGYILALE